MGGGVSLFEDEANDPERRAFGKVEDLGAQVAPPSRGEPDVHRSRKGAGTVRQVRLRERGPGGFEPAGPPLPARAEPAVTRDGTLGFVQTVEIERGIVERPPIGVMRWIPLESPGEADQAPAGLGARCGPDQAAVRLDTARTETNEPSQRFDQEDGGAARRIEYRFLSGQSIRDLVEDQGDERQPRAETAVP